MKKLDGFKLATAAVFTAALGVGCASSGYARVDTDPNDMNDGVGASAQAEIGSGSDSDMRFQTRADDYNSRVDDGDLAANATVSSLGRAPETRADWVNRFPFYDRRLQVHEVYTFEVPDEAFTVALRDTFRDADNDWRAEGSVREASGGFGTSEIGRSSDGNRVIRHSPNPMR